MFRIFSLRLFKKRHQCTLHVYQISIYIYSKPSLTNHLPRSTIPLYRSLSFCSTPLILLQDGRKTSAAALQMLDGRLGRFYCTCIYIIYICVYFYNMYTCEYVYTHTCLHIHMHLWCKLKWARQVVTIETDGGATVTERSRNNKEIIECNDKNSPTRLYTRIIRYTSHMCIQ